MHAISHLYTGSVYVNWQLRLPAKFWTAEWAKGRYGDAWDSTEWLVIVTKHRPKSKKWKEEWAFTHVDGVEYFFGCRTKNMFLKENRLSGVFVYVFFATFTAWNSHFLYVCAEISCNSSSFSALSSNAPPPIDHVLASVPAAELQVASEIVGSMLSVTENLGQNALVEASNDVSEPPVVKNVSESSSGSESEHQVQSSESEWSGWDDEPLANGAALGLAPAHDDEIEVPTAILDLIQPHSDSEPDDDADNEGSNLEQN